MPETRGQLACLLSLVAANEALLQHEDAAAVRILNEPPPPDEAGEVYATGLERHQALWREYVALQLHLAVDPEDSTTAALRLRPYGRLPRGADGRMRWWKRLPDGQGWVECPLADVFEHRVEGHTVRWARLYRFLHGQPMGRPT